MAKLRTKVTQSKEKKLIESKCYQCRNKVFGKPYYITGMTKRVLCSEDCKNVYFVFATIPIDQEKPSNMMMKIIYLFTILCGVESTNNPRAVGDDGKAIGIVQIHIEAIKDVNRVYKTKYVLKDAFEVEASRDIFKKYLTIWGTKYEEKTGCKVTLETLARIWNGGPKGYEKEATKAYWQKVHSSIKSERNI